MEAGSYVAAIFKPDENQNRSRQLHPRGAPPVVCLVEVSHVSLPNMTLDPAPGGDYERSVIGWLCFVLSSPWQVRI